MAFHDVKFPDSIAQGATGGPGFSTTIITGSGGHEQRQGNWQVARRRYNVATGLKRRADVAVLLAFFIARAGRLHSFRFKDWSDYEVPRQTIGTTDGAAGRAACIVRSGHASEPEEHSRKPAGWMADWCRAWVPPGGLVLDLYAGLRSVAEAVVMAGEGRRYIGAEIDPERHASACARVAAAARG